MKNRPAKTIISLALAAVLTCSGAAAQAAEAVGTEYADTLSIESCAANVKRIYKEKYPEQADIIDEVVDIITGDEEFIGIFEREGAKAFQIAEDSLHDVLDPSAAPAAFDEDYYYVDYVIPNVQQIANNYCGVACLVMAMRGAGLIPYTNDKNVLNNYQEQYGQEIRLPKGANYGAHIDKLIGFLQDKFGKSPTGWTYKSKALTRFTYSRISDFIVTTLLAERVPILSIPKPCKLSYYTKSYDGGGHYIVVTGIDTATGEINVIDPHFDNEFFGRHTINISELEAVPDIDDDLWMCAYTRTSDDPYIYE